MKSSFTRRLHDAQLTVKDIAFVTNISENRLEEHARGRGTLTTAELDRVELAIAHRPVVYRIWRRQVEESAAAVTILKRADGVIKVKTERPAEQATPAAAVSVSQNPTPVPGKRKQTGHRLSLEDRRKAATATNAKIAAAKAAV